jgi:hypothetical protein
MSNRDWTVFDTCPKCQEKPGSPCRSTRPEHRTTIVTMAQPHEGRKRIAGSIGSHVKPIRSDRTVDPDRTIAPKSDPIAPMPIAPIAVSAIRSIQPDPIDPPKADPVPIRSHDVDRSDRTIARLARSIRSIRSHDRTTGTVDPIDPIAPTRDWHLIGAIVAVGLTALVAAIVSYSHWYDVAIAYGQSGLTAVLIALPGDGLVLGSTAALLWAARSGRSGTGLVRFFDGLAIVATIGVNVLHGWSHGPIGAVLAAWPALAFTGAICTLHWVLKERNK